MGEISRLQNDLRGAKNYFKKAHSIAVETQDREIEGHAGEKAESRRFVWTEVVPESSKPVFNLAHFCKMAFSLDGLGDQRMRLMVGSEATAHGPAPTR